MKSKEFILEAKKPKVTAPKPRNFVAKNQQTAGAGAHRDKKKEQKQGNVKHKAKQFEQGVAEKGYGTHPSQRVDPRTGKKYVPPKSPLGKGVAEGNEPDEGYLDKVISDLHKDAFGMRPDREFGREWISSSYEEKLEIYNNLLKNLHSDIDEATGDEKFDTIMRTIKKGTKKQATADRREREADSRQRARDAFGPSLADKLSIRSDKDVAEGYTTEKQIMTRIRQIMHDRKLSGTESNAGELHRLKQQLKDMRSQQGVSEGDEPDEQYLDKVISDLHKDALGMRPDREFGREWMSSSYEEKLRIYNNMLKNLHSDLDEDYKDRLRQMRQNTQDKLAGMRSNTQSTLGRLSGRDKPASSANDKKTPLVGDKIEFGQFNKPDSMKTATVIKVGGGGMSLVVKTDDGKEGTINLGNKSLSLKIIEDSDAITQNLPFGSVRLPKPDPVSSQQVITQRPGGEKEKENMPPKIKRLWDRIKQKPNVYVEVMNIIDEFDTLRDDEIEDEIKAFLGSDELIMRAVGIVLQYEYEKMKNESISENSDWGEHREILEDVLQTLEREVEWPLSEVMEPREFRPLLSALVRAVNDKLLSMDRDGNQ